MYPQQINTGKQRVLYQFVPRRMIELPMVGQTYLDRRHNFLYSLYRVIKKKKVLLDAGATSLIGFLLQESELFLQSYIYVKNNKTA